MPDGRSAGRRGCEIGPRQRRPETTQLLSETTGVTTTALGECWILVSVGWTLNLSHAGVKRRRSSIRDGAEALAGSCVRSRLGGRDGVISLVRAGDRAKRRRSRFIESSALRQGARVGGREWALGRAGACRSTTAVYGSVGGCGCGHGRAFESRKSAGGHHTGNGAPALGGVVREVAPRRVRRRMLRRGGHGNVQGA